MTANILATSDPLKVAAMKAEFHADRLRNQPRRVAIARTMRLLCAPVDWCACRRIEDAQCQTSLFPESAKAKASEQMALIV